MKQEGGLLYLSHDFQVFLVLGCNSMTLPSAKQIPSRAMPQATAWSCVTPYSSSVR